MIAVRHVIAAVIAVGSRWVAGHAYGRADAIPYRVAGVTAAGVYIVPLVATRSPGHLFSEEEFRRLYRPDPRVLLEGGAS